jgi:hypothetical protein
MPVPWRGAALSIGLIGLIVLGVSEWLFVEESEPSGGAEPALEPSVVPDPSFVSTDGGFTASCPAPEGRLETAARAASRPKRRRWSSRRS